MKIEKIGYQDGNTRLEGHLAHEDARPGARPLVAIVHAWAGQSDFERDKAERLAGLGYAGLALDLFGKGVLGKSKEENSALIRPFLEDRGLILSRIHAGLDAVRGHAAVDTRKIGAIGFCFGGLCALDLARSGADVAGVVSFHGLLGAPQGRKGDRIKAKVLALHGWDDPMATPEQLAAFAREMTQAGAYWQIHAYGNTMHAFTNPQANDPEFGTLYQEAADRRSWAAMTGFFAEVFGG